MESTERTCVRCDEPLPPGHAAGRPCPRCLLSLGLASSEVVPAGAAVSSQATPSAAELAAAFPGLEILEVLGEGGMGVVYRARQRDLDRMVALKILRPPPEFDPSFAERFTREARALARLTHPNIVQVHDFGRTGEYCFLLLELVEGTNLRRQMQADELTAAQALEIVAQVSRALRYAHGQGVVHRDVKPENILLDAAGDVKIVDFGLAKIARVEESALRLTHTGQAMGTPQYMAPEQLERPLEVDHRADIYSLGVVFYELLTGELPLGRFAPPSRKVQVDVRLDDVVLRALEKEPERRYQQVSEVETDLEEVRRHPRAGGATRREARRARRVERDGRRRRSTVWFGIAAFVLLITCVPLSCAGLFLAGWSGSREVETTPPDPAPVNPTTRE